MSFHRNILASAIALACAGCSTPTESDSPFIACTEEARAGINLVVVDSLTSAAPIGPGAMRLRATDGAFVDSLVSTTPVGSWATAWERSGTYSVTVDADDYLAWRKDGVVVTRDVCHVIPVSLIARLIRK